MQAVLRLVEQGAPDDLPTVKGGVVAAAPGVAPAQPFT